MLIYCLRQEGNMNKIKLNEYQKNIAKELVDILYLLQVLEHISDGEGKTSTLLNIIIKKTKFAFKNVEECRKIL